MIASCTLMPLAEQLFPLRRRHQRTELLECILVLADPVRVQTHRV